MKINDVKSKDYRETVSAAVARGWILSRTRRHARLMKPGCRIVVFPMTGSDWRGLANLKADLKRAEEGR